MSDLEDVLRRARSAGVTQCIDVGTEPDEWIRSLYLAETRADLYSVLGLHPNSAGFWSDDLADLLRELLSRPGVVGVGETGLDYYRMGASKEQQLAVFIEHLRLARELQLPAVIHGRDAYDDILDTIERYGSGTVGIMHSYAGTPEQATRAVRLGYYISISGPVTYKNGASIREVAATVPLDRLLVETDSPYLPPHPHRGKRNEPAYVALTARGVSEARGISLDDLAKATTENACRLFRL